ncbi:MAG: hypothetical protein GY753_17270, partial [Gammaproteobacteria bacterium]|nr:hypothetical protein [Gammaproteobacteria bacterium]
TWVEFAANTKDVSNSQRDFARMQAWVTTFLLSLQLIISLLLIAFASNVVGIIFEAVLFIVAYIVVLLISAFDPNQDTAWNPLTTYNKIIEWIATDLLQFKLLAQVAEGGVNLGGIDLTMDYTSTTTSGPMPGAWFQISTTISTTVSASNSGTSSDVAGSWAFSRWDEPAEQPIYLQNLKVNSSPVVFGSGISSSSVNCDTTVGTDNKKDCYASAVIQFEPAAAGRNSAIPFENTLEANLKYYSCEFFGAGGVNVYTCGTDTTYSYSGSSGTDLKQTEAEFVIDILPDDLDALFNWNVKDPVSNATYARFNLDVDNDGLTAAEEDTLDTDVDLWDTDGDELSDGWEKTNIALGVSAVLSDTDGDGLSDKDEMILGTSAGVADSDGDGLEDGEEVCRLNNQGNLVGGWKVSQVGDYWTCSDPMNYDHDGDGLIDSQEKLAGTSPYSPNTAPSLRVTANPSVIYNGGLVTVLKAGDPLTVTIQVKNNTAGEIINNPMSLDYSTTVLYDMQVVSQTGSVGYTPPTPANTATGRLSWGFDSNVLHSVEEMTSTLSTGALSTIETSQITTMTATLFYTDAFDSSLLKSITQTVSVRVDEDAPSSSIIAPQADEAINGSSYTTGGFATDPTSWPSNVDVRISGDNGYVSDWQTATGASSWAWTWTPLPADGVYTMQSQATDYVGNMESPGSGVSFIVDNTPPGASFSNLTDGQALT